MTGNTLIFMWEKMRFASGRLFSTARAITFRQVDEALSRHLSQLSREKNLAAARYQKFRRMGAAVPQKENP